MQNHLQTLEELAKTKTALIVDDDLLYAEILKDALEELFSKVIICDSVENALKELNLHSYDIIITDIEMPGQNGIKLCEIIRRDNANQLILVSSAYSNEEYLYSLLNIGVDGFIKKPSKIDDLRKSLLKTLLKGAANV